MGGCTSAPISVSDQEIRNIAKPPEPKIVVEIPNLQTQKSKKIIEDCLDDVTQTTSENTINESEIINGCHQMEDDNNRSRRNSLATNHQPADENNRQISHISDENNRQISHISDENTFTWSERRNSEKEKVSFTKYKIDQAHGELQKRLSLRNTTHSKCPVCGDLGPETSNQYYTFYLVVPSVVCKTKCRRCNVYFSFEYIGMVKSLHEAVNLVLDEEL